MGASLAIGMDGGFEVWMSLFDLLLQYVSHFGTYSIISYNYTRQVNNTACTPGKES